MVNNRITVEDIAKHSGLHPNTVRRWADRGWIKSKRDFRGWRFFPNHEETIARIDMLLSGEINIDN